MSAAAQIQQPQTQQPVVVYPNAVTGQAPPSPHSNGSFGTVFIVLAVIIAISAIACCLGRLCNRRLSKQKPPKHNHHGQIHHGQNQQGQSHHGQNQHGQNHHGQNHNVFRPNEKDIEFGFDKMPPLAKSAGNGDLRGFRMPEHGDLKNETKPADGWEL